MIEIPEAITLSDQINQVVKGKTITKVTVAFSKHKFAWYNGDPQDYPAMLENTIIHRAKATGGFVEIAVGEATILFSDGVNLRYLQERKEIPKKHQLLLEFSDGFFFSASVHMYGGVVCYTGDDYDSEYYLAAKEKLSPLTTEFDSTYFHGMMSSDEVKNLSIKGFLATEQRIPGLGNGVLQDILFNARLHPKRKMNTLTEVQETNLFNAIKMTLTEMFEHGGRNTEKDIFGQPGGYITKMSKNTVGLPCVVCRSEILKSSYLGGSIYYCKRCQEK